MEDGSDYGRHDDTEEFDDDEAFGEVDETVPRANTNSHDVNTANIAELLATVKEVSRAAAVLPQLKEEISLIRKELLEVKQYAEAVHSYCQTLIMSSGSPAARENEQLKQHVKPVENIFTKAYIVAAVTSTIPKYAFELVAGMNLREDCASAHLVLATVMHQEHQRSIDTKAAARNSDLKSLIVKLLIVHSATLWSKLKGAHPFRQRNALRFPQAKLKHPQTTNRCQEIFRRRLRSAPSGWTAGIFALRFTMRCNENLVEKMCQTTHIQIPDVPRNRRCHPTRNLKT